MAKDFVQMSLLDLMMPEVVEALPQEETENERRDTICRMWRDCEHNGICFTPQNEEDGICFIDEPHRIPAELRPTFSRDEQKVLAAGFALVRYSREERKIELSEADPNNGWTALEPFATYAAAERKLKELKGKGNIETGLDGKIIMSGWNQHGGLIKHGFEFYRVYGLRHYDSGFCIKQGSKNWSNWGKFGNRGELKVAWDKLMNEDMKALEG